MDLLNSAYCDRMELVRYLIEEGKVDVDCKESGFPPICDAAWEGNIEMIEYLVSVGANINAKADDINAKHNGNVNNRNALHSAACTSQLKTVKLLVSFGCDFKAKGNDGKTPLQLIQGKGNRTVVEFLTQVEHK
jgi:ankyrin repeat protein